MNKYCLPACLGLLVFFATGCQSPVSYTKGVGIYPGVPSQDFSPELVTDNDLYGNVARNRMTCQSSAFDYNLTGQLATDGIIDTYNPSYINVSTQNGDLKKREKGWLFDFKVNSVYQTTGQDIFIMLELEGRIPEFTRMDLKGLLVYEPEKRSRYRILCYGSADGENWDLIKSGQGYGFPGKERPNPYAQMANMPKPPVPEEPQPSFQFSFSPPRPERIIEQSYEFSQPVQYKFYKIEFHVPGALEWTFADWDFYHNDKIVTISPSVDFHSSWMSAGSGSEWLMVDLGTTSTIDSIALHWINLAVKGTLEGSED